MECKNLERVICKELEQLDAAYANKNEFTDADAKKFDLLVHAWKSYLTAKAMHEANLAREEDARSFARNRQNGRYMDDGLWRSGHYAPYYDPGYRY